MEATEREQRVGMTWLVIGLVVSVCFTSFLMKADDLLTYSDREEVLADTLRELRTAQTGLASQVNDPRQLIDPN